MCLYAIKNQSPVCCLSARLSRAPLSLPTLLAKLRMCMYVGITLHLPMVDGTGRDE